MKEGVQLLKGKGPFMWPVLLSQSEKSASLSCQHSCVWRCQALRQEYTPFAQIFALIYSVLRSRRCQKSEPEWSQRWQISQEIAYDGHRHVLFSFIILVVKSHVSAWVCCVTTWCSSASSYGGWQTNNSITATFWPKFSFLYVIISAPALLNDQLPQSFPSTPTA